ncbi:MAG: GerMN domain-containing protein [Lachnospiraceae bacterium]|nr:GerMN domain-containing protein [Lachnospiraceae bacterium]
MSLIRRLFLTAFFLLTAALLSACSDERQASVDMREKESGPYVFRIFRTDDTESMLVWESIETPDAGLTHIDRIKEVIKRLESTPADPEMKKLMPEGVTMDSVYFGQDGQLILDFGKSYNNLKTIPELLLRSGYVKTLCQFDFVEYVEFYVDDTPLILRGDVVPGLMKSTDFVDNTGNSTYFSQEVELTVYFVKKTQKMLGSDIYKVTYDGISSYEKLVTDILIEGPGIDGTEFVPTLPEGTVVNKISSGDGIVYADLNEEFLNYRDNIGEELTIYSLVNSLCDLQGITKVQITVNGTSRKSIDKYGQSGLIERRPDLIVNEKAGEADG